MISVIVPIYNVEEYLEECLQSIQNQTHKDFECIMVNDGSTDSSVEMAQKFVDGDARFKLIHQENGGLSAARNTGLKYVNGDFLTFVDSDDLLHHQFLELTLAHIDDADMVETPVSILREYMIADLDSSRDEIKSVFYGTVEEAVIGVSTYELNTSACMKLYKKELLKELHFPVGKTNEDIPVILHLYKEGYTVKKIDFPGYFYRKGHESITGTSFSQRDFDSFYIIGMIKEDFKDRKELTPYLHQIFSGHLLYKYITKMTPFMSESKQFTRAIKEYGRTANWKSSVLKVALVSPMLAWMCARSVICFRKVTKYRR